ncbi:MAG: MBL fold metallo-hydrolase [Verrucomicrobia bacterium]|nr:MBL fold metallo-hydrolase [Verrucomicrobiota bacterium]
MSIRLTILGSGSRGNCAYLETDGVRLLIDAGFSGKRIRERLASIGRTPETLNGILITHEHSDHTMGLKIIAAKLGIPLYANRLTLDAVSSQTKTPFNSKIFHTGQSFEVGDVEVETFSIPHDAQDPVGFLIRSNHGNVGFLTDLGHATRLVLDRVRPAKALVLETNYDLQLLQEDTRRPWSIKQRITSRHGHLSNSAAGEAARELVSDELGHIFMAHLSKDCNDPAIAEKTVQQEIDKTGARHIRIHRTNQDAPCPTLILGDSPNPATMKSEIPAVTTNVSPKPESQPALPKVPNKHTPSIVRSQKEPPNPADEQKHRSFFSGLQDALGDLNEDTKSDSRKQDISDDDT